MGEQAAHDAEIERAAEARFASREATIRREAGDAAKAALAPKLAEAADIKRQMKELRSTFETTMKQQLAAQAEALEKAATERVNAEKEKRFADNLKHQQELEDLKRRTAKERPQELGDQGELDLFEILMTEFPQDQIARVPKGQNGADIIQRIFVNGICVGANCFEVKNHKRWQNGWIAKLREDTIEAGASHGILVTTAFPAERRELTVIDNMVVAAPARAIAVAHILRRAVVAFHALRLSNQQRDEKTAQQYRGGNACHQRRPTSSRSRPPMRRIRRRCGKNALASSMPFKTCIASSSAISTASSAANRKTSCEGRHRPTQR